MSDKCNCVFCENYNHYKWAVVMECKCSCHDGDGIKGHESLCCAYPNALRKNNPYKDLKPSEHYKKIIENWEKECEL